MPAKGYAASRVFGVTHIVPSAVSPLASAEPTARSSRPALLRRHL